MATKSSKIHVYIFMILIFFLCLLCFSVGTFVGKNVTENEMRKSQGEVAGNLNERTISSIEEGLFDESNKTEEGDELSLTNEEINSLAEEFSDNPKEAGEKTDDPNVQEGSTDTVSKADKANDSKLEKNPISDVTNRIAQSESATEAYKQPRLPSTVMPLIASSSLGKYTIQIASYTNEKEAQKHATELKQKGYSAFYIPAKIRNNDWFRVSVGLFDSGKKANTFRKSFVLKTKLEAAIVQKITK